MAEEIDIPADDSPLGERIYITEDIANRNAETLLSSPTQSNRLFVLFTNYVISRIIKVNNIPDDVDRITGSLTDLTTLHDFIEQDTENYQFSTIKYKKYLQSFVNKIENSKLISTDNFSLIQKDGASFKVSSSTKDKFSLKNSVTFFDEDADLDFYDKTISEIMNINVAEYPIRPDKESEKYQNRDISRDGWLITRFDKDQPLYDIEKLVKLFESSANLCKIKKEGENITLTIDTYTYFDTLLKEAGYTGLLGIKGGQRNLSRAAAKKPDGKSKDGFKIVNGKKVKIDGKDYWYKIVNGKKVKSTVPVLDKDKIDDNKNGNFYITYLGSENSVNVVTGDGLFLNVQEDVPFSSRTFGTVQQRRGEKDNEYKERMENRNLETDVTEGVNNKVLSTGIFSQQKEYSFGSKNEKQNRAEIEKLRLHVNNLTTGGSIGVYAKSVLLNTGNSPNNSDEDIDSLSNKSNSTGLIDLLFTPKDHIITVGKFIAKYKIIKEPTGQKENDFYNYIATNSRSEKESKKRADAKLNITSGAKDSKKQYYLKLEEILNDLEQNSLEDFLGGGEFPELFFETLLEEINLPTDNTEIRLINLTSTDVKEIINVDDTLEDIQDKLLDEDIESNSIIEDDEEVEDDEDDEEIEVVESEDKDDEDVESIIEDNVDDVYYDKLQKIILTFITDAKADLLNKDKAVSGNVGKTRKIMVIEHQSSKFEQLATLDATKGQRGGISEDESNRRLRSSSNSKSKTGKKSEQVSRGGLKHSIARTFKTLKNSVENIK
tara:strand:+ start:523 stop:2841 length:2319 start_codon:yes stop_codon:yes gene_type:complete